ncbi:unnamed protein product [Meganyctiphanes norvegica]|uniref:Uncharacterized protein n=1 Tax=Meganyctiphanes norvegica TaxID=48144 RepID=A0AAV2QAU5_MEGNR
MPPLNEPPWTYKEVNRKVHENFIQYEFPRLAILADSWLLDRRLYNLRSGDYWSDIIDGGKSKHFPKALKLLNQLEYLNVKFSEGIMPVDTLEDIRWVTVL